MIKSMQLSVGLILLCLGCSVFAAEDQNANGRHFSGSIILLVADDFEKQISKFYYELVTEEDGRTFTLHFPDTMEIPEMKSGTRIEVVGRLIDERIHVETLSLLE